MLRHATSEACVTYAIGNIIEWPRGNSVADSESYMGLFYEYFAHLPIP